MSQCSAASARLISSSEAGRLRVGTLRNEAVIPASSAVVSTWISPTGLSNSRAPTPSRSARATAVAIVA